ncbi:MAG: OmpP1/FadL family transporter [bacterium]
MYASFHVSIIVFISGAFLFVFVMGGRPFPPREGSAAYPEYPDMKMNATPNPVGSGAKAMGMGGSFISVADDATAASWNPAGLPQVLRPEASMAWSWFSGKSCFKTSGIEAGDIDDDSAPARRLNYLSLVLPMVLWRRNMVFSLNYQHLYEFSMDIHYVYTRIGDDFTILNEAHKTQGGSLATISPAYALQITPSLFIGVAANFWPDTGINNGWENINKAHGVEKAGEESYMTSSEIYENYRFSGFNLHCGFLYKSDTFPFAGKQRQFRIGGVVKTPFKAEILHEYEQIWYRTDPNNPSQVDYFEWLPPSQKLSLRMPLSYGLGCSLVFSDSYIMAIDIHHTRWDQYVLTYGSGRQISPINRLDKKEAHIQPTTQLRLGGQYRYMYHPKRILINLRAGLFYDPEPASGDPDDFYGMSMGIGITYRNSFSFDSMYQLRSGEKKNIESLMGHDIASTITQHYIYSSFIYYF